MQGLPYYERFIKRFPTLQKLAQASEEEVMREWQGLGYYSRARNLHNCAKILQQNRQGQWPETYEELLKLPGIGEYTAAAIASFAYREPVPVIDGNVFRVMSRIFGIDQDIAAHQARKVFIRHAKMHIPRDQPDLYNQAMMEYGATICLPQPKCQECIFTKECYAYQHQLQNELPVNLKKVKIKKRYLYYIVFTLEEKIYMKQRRQNDVWQHLYDFYLVEEKDDKKIEEILYQTGINLNESEIVMESPIYKHILTHQRINARFLVVNLVKPLPDSFSKIQQLQLYDPFQIDNLPKPKLISNFLKDLYD